MHLNVSKSQGRCPPVSMRGPSPAAAALVLAALLLVTAGPAAAQTRAKRKRSRTPAAATRPAPPSASAFDPTLDSPTGDSAPDEDALPLESATPIAAPADPAPAAAPPRYQAPAAQPSEGAGAPASPESNPPAMAPFTGPTDSRPLSPPSGLAGLGMGDPLGTNAGFEESLQRMMSEAVVSTASKREQRIADVPLTVSWIPGEELEGTGRFTLCDAIQYFPGLECRRGPMRKAAVSARGLGSNYLSNRLLLLRNGRPQTDPWTGQFYADETMPLTNIKQVEVIRGPGSALYGSNAFSGVINVIDRLPGDLMRDGRDYGVDARFLAGQFSSYRLETTGAGRAGPVEGLVNYYGYNTKGPDIFATPDNQDALVHQVNGRVKVGPVLLDADYTNATIGRPGGTQLSTVGNCGRCHFTPNDEERVQNFNASAQVDQKINDNLRLFGQAYTLFKRREVDTETLTPNDSSALGKRNRVGAEARALVSVADYLAVTFGGDAKRDTVNNQNIRPELTSDDTFQTVFGGFVDAELRPTSRLALSAGARYDYYAIPEQVWAQRSAQISPRASIVFHALPQLTFRTNYGRAFRAPSLAELAIDQQMYAATLRGNPNLRAETLDTVEAAVDFWPFNRTVRLTGTGFWNNAKNFINQELVGGSTSEFRNIGDARVVGFEAEAAAQVPAINSSFDVAYQYLDARSLAFGGRPEQQLDYAPNHRVYLRGRTAFGKVAFAELYGLYVGDRFDPGFHVDPNTGVATRVKLGSYITASARVGANIYDGISISLIGTNLFEASYDEVHGYPANPRGVFSELTFRY